MAGFRLDQALDKPPTDHLIMNPIHEDPISVFSRGTLAHDDDHY